MTTSFSPSYCSTITFCRVSPDAASKSRTTEAASCFPSNFSRVESRVLSSVSDVEVARARFSASSGPQSSRTVAFGLGRVSDKSALEQ